MAAVIKPIDTYKTRLIYDSANTHPGCITKSLTVFCGLKGHFRVRYRVGSARSYVDARKKIEAFIDKNP